MMCQIFLIFLLSCRRVSPHIRSPCHLYVTVSHNCFKLRLFRKHIKIIDKIWHLKYNFTTADGGTGHARCTVAPLHRNMHACHLCSVLTMGRAIKQERATTLECTQVIKIKIILI